VVAFSVAAMVWRRSSRALARSAARWSRTVNWSPRLSRTPGDPVLARATVERVTEPGGVRDMVMGGTIARLLGL